VQFFFFTLRPEGCGVKQGRIKLVKREQSTLVLKDFQVSSQKFEIVLEFWVDAFTVSAYERHPIDVFVSPLLFCGTGRAGTRDC